MNQHEIIEEFCKDASYYLVKFKSKGNEEFGKILKKQELQKINLDEHSIYRSIEYENKDVLFVHDLMSNKLERISKNPLQLLLDTLEEAKVIELVYPNIFRWIFDGLTVKAYAIIPSGNFKSNTTITRYGGTESFAIILRQHLENIGKLRKGISPNYDFIKNKEKFPETELSIGSMNLFNKLYSVGINLSMNYLDILKNSKENINIWQPINTLDMKFWAREINPDFIDDAKHIKLDKTLELDENFHETIKQYYPPCIIKLTKLKKKGNYKRFLIARFFLAVHKPHEAKFLYHTVLGNEEREHVKHGNCNTQWGFIRNNLKRYSCPSCKELKNMCDKNCKLNHPLEKIQEKLNAKNEN